MEIMVFRLKPGDDLKRSIQSFATDNQIESGFIISCVGGLSQAVVRMAGAAPDSQDVRTFQEDLEIVSLVGTISPDGVHLHMSFSDKNGMVRGGHLKEGTIIDPTAEIVIGISKGVKFTREFDPETGFDELVIKK